MIEMKVLDYSDVRMILKMNNAIELVEKAFREKGLGRVQMPAKTYLFFDKYNGDLRTMPAYFQHLDIAGVKIVNSHPDNPAKHGLPTVMAVVVLVDPKTGRPLCLMDGTLITGVRTGAAVAVATKYLARKSSKTIGVVGAGSMAPYSIEGLHHVLRIDSIKIFDISRNRAERLAREVELNYGISASAVERCSDAVKDVDVLVTLTPSREPIIKDEWIFEGVHINAMGADAPGKEELDPVILKRAKIVVDDLEQAIHSGEVNVPISRGILHPNEIYGELGEVVAGIKPGRVSDSEITIFDSTGLAIQDVITAWHVYEEAERKGIGRKIVLH